MLELFIYGKCGIAANTSDPVFSELRVTIEMNLCPVPDYQVPLGEQGNT